MNVSAQVKSLLYKTGLRQNALQDALGMKSQQSLSNKFALNRWSADDLIKVAEVTGCKLAFIAPDGERLYLTAENEKSPDT